MASAPQVSIPASTSTVEVSIIDTTARLKLIPVSAFAGPPIKGFELFEALAYSFLITHKDASSGKERKVIFDLGPPKNWTQDLPPHLVAAIESWKADITISKYVSEILEDNDIRLDTIEAVIWSHAHWDHIGRPSLFHPSTTLITGTGVKEAFAPGYPTRKDSVVLAREFEGREVRELDFSQSNINIGSFRAIDYFGDGSFYLFEAPGHAVGHVNGLARTTADPASSFILMGADSFHHASQLRPSEQLTLPASVAIPNFHPTPCPGELLEQLHPSHARKSANVPSQYHGHYPSAKVSDPKNSAFMTISVQSDGSSTAIDVDEARNTITKLQDFDADERVMVIAAHDSSLGDVLEFFPRTANDWKAKGWKDSGRWKFLEDFKRALEEARAA